MKFVLKTIVSLIITTTVLVGCKTETKTKTQQKEVSKESLNLNAMIQPSPSTAKLEDPNYYIWGTTMVKSHLDGKYHIFYSRWPKEYGFHSWVTHSEIAHGVGDSPLGPFTFVDVPLPVRGAEFWDGLCTHNPTVKYFEGKYYLYYMGNTGDGKIPKNNDLNWVHRNNQRVGVAVADHPNGPWVRKDTPLIDVSKDDKAPDALMTNNATITEKLGGGYLMLYKSAAKEKPLPFGGPVYILTATAEKPDGPFTKKLKPIFTAEKDDFPAEDPYIWTDKDKYYAIVKDMNGAFTSVPHSSALFVSKNGMDWVPAKHPFVTKMEIQWENSDLQQVKHLERAQLLLEDGKPSVLLFASTVDYNHSFNVQIPLKLNKKQ